MGSHVVSFNIAASGFNKLSLLAADLSGNLPSGVEADLVFGMQTLKSGLEGLRPPAPPSSSSLELSEQLPFRSLYETCGKRRGVACMAPLEMLLANSGQFQQSSRQALADIFGVSRVTFYKWLVGWHDQGLVTSDNDGGPIVFSDKALQLYRKGIENFERAMTQQAEMATTL